MSTAPDLIRVVLVDDQPMLRYGFTLVLEGSGLIKVVGEASNGAEAVELVRRVQPDVVLMDVRMPVMDGIAATARITEENPAANVIIITTFDLDEYVFSGLQAGASAFLLKDAEPEELVSAVQVVNSGEAVVAPRATASLLEHFVRRTSAAGERCPEEQLVDLTPREREVLVEMASGASNQEIAQRLFVSETTVKTHVGRILHKLGLRDRVHAVIFAYEHGLITPGANPM